MGRSLFTLAAITVGLLLPGRGAVAAPTGVALVDGRTQRGVLVSADTDKAVVLVGGKRMEFPTRLLVSARLAPDPAEVSPVPYNLFLAGGDRLRGKVDGDGEAILFESATVKGFRTSLEQVSAVCLGTFFGQVQTNYRNLFERQRGRERESIVVNRGSKPFSFLASVLEIRKDALVVRVGDQQRELPRDKVYGFTRPAPETALLEGDAILARIHLRDGGRITLPLKQVTATSILAGDTTIDRKAVTRIEFTGNHIAHISDMQPVSADETALFGKAPRWRRDAMVLGGPLRLDGVTYARGIGVQSASRIEYALGRRWKHFFVRCGIDDAASREGEATFRVLGDGKLLHEVERRRGQAPAVLMISVSGVERLVLEVLPGASYTSDLCDWADARVYGVASDANRKDKR